MRVAPDFNAVTIRVCVTHAPQVLKIYSLETDAVVFSYDLPLKEAVIKLFWCANGSVQWSEMMCGLLQGGLGQR